MGLKDDGSTEQGFWFALLFIGAFVAGVFVGSYFDIRFVAKERAYPPIEQVR